MRDKTNPGKPQRSRTIITKSIAPEDFLDSFNESMNALIWEAERDSVTVESLMHFKLEMNRTFRNAA